MTLEARPLTSAEALALFCTQLAFAEGAGEQPGQPPDAAVRSEVDDTHEEAVSMGAGGPLPQAKAYSPYAGRDYPTRVLWGDTHFHTTDSGDAFTAGTRFTPEQAYRIARGEEVIATTGMPADVMYGNLKGT